MDESPRPLPLSFKDFYGKFSSFLARGAAGTGNRLRRIPVLFLWSLDKWPKATGGML